MLNPATRANDTIDSAYWALCISVIFMFQSSNPKWPPSATNVVRPPVTVVREDL